LSELRTLKVLIGQGLAVLLGILTAFAVDAAWDIREEARVEAAYLQALRDEVEENRANYLASLDDLAEAQAAADDFFESVVLARGDVDDRTILAMMWAAGPMGFQPSRAALDDLIGSGGTAIISDPVLRRAIVEYERQLALDEAARTALAEHWSDVLVPYFRDHGSIPDMFPEGFMSLPRPDPGLSIDAEAFVGNRTFANIFAFHQFRIRRVRRSHERVVDQLNRVHELIGG